MNTANTLECGTDIQFQIIGPTRTVRYNAITRDQRDILSFDLIQSKVPSPPYLYSFHHPNLPSVGQRISSTSPVQTAIAVSCHSSSGRPCFSNEKVLF